MVVANIKEIIYNTLNANHIEIPFPQQDVYVRHLEMPKYRFRDYDDEDKIPSVRHASHSDTESQYVPPTSPESLETPAPKKRGRPKKSTVKKTTEK